MELSTITAALLCTTAISLLPNILLFIFPNTTYKSNSSILLIGQALAAGGLLGDVFLHTLPHAFMSSSSGDEDVELIGLAIISGFLVFFIFDILVREFGHEHHHHHDHDHASKNNNGNKKTTEMKPNLFSSNVILNLVADSLHNFTDGIAIGASFASSATILLATTTAAAAETTTTTTTTTNFMNQVWIQIQSRGGLASLAVLFHEIPHELGDFSILVSAGMTKKQAIQTQFTTAIAAYCGTIIGLFGMEQMKLALGYDLMVPFTAGGFIYLAAVTILPSLLLEETKKGLMIRLLHVMAFIVGIGFMYFVAILEHQNGGCSGHSHSHGHHHHDEHDVVDNQDNHHHNNHDDHHYDNSYHDYDHHSHDHHHHDEF